MNKNLTHTLRYNKPLVRTAGSLAGRLEGRASNPQSSPDIIDN